MSISLKKRTESQRRWDSDPAYREIADRYRERFSGVADRSAFVDLFNENVPRTESGLLDFRGFEWDRGRIKGGEGEGIIRISNANLTDIDFSEGSMFTVEIADSKISSCGFRSVLFYDNRTLRTAFENCDFTECVWHSGTIRGSFSGCRFDRSKVKGNGVHMAGTFDHCSFADINWKKDVTVSASTTFHRCFFSGYVDKVYVYSAQQCDSASSPLVFYGKKLFGLRTETPAGFSECDCDSFEIREIGIPDEVKVLETILQRFAVSDYKLPDTGERRLDLVLRQNADTDTASEK